MLNHGVCENCSKPVVHRHKRKVHSGGCDDTLFLCRKCDGAFECDDCVDGSPLRFYETHFAGDADLLASEAMVTAVFAIEFADTFLLKDQQEALSRIYTDECGNKFRRYSGNTLRRMA